MRQTGKIAKIEVRIDPNDKRLIARAAGRVGMSVSSYMRQFALKAARRELREQ